MRASKLKTVRRVRRKKGIRKRVHGTSDRPRLTVFRSLRHIYAQMIDDDRGATVCAESSMSRELRERLKSGGNVDAAQVVGAALAEKAARLNIKAVRFDRNGYRFHGRIKGLADAVREAGIVF